MILEHLTIYGRVKSVALRRDLNVENREFAHMVSVTWTMWEWIPVWAHGSHLEVVTENETYKLYNPQGLAFDINQLLSLVKTYMQQIGVEIKSIDIIK